MPFGFVVTKGSKIVSVTSVATPGPESATEISMALLPLRRAETAIDRRSALAPEKRWDTDRPLRAIGGPEQANSAARYGAAVRSRAKRHTSISGCWSA